MSKPSTDDRFWAKVDKNGPVKRHMTSNCWLWTGSTNGGYGVFYFNRRQGYAHRYAFGAANNRAPGSSNVCHQCDEPLCVRAEHLFLGTDTDNMRDCAEKGRLGGVATHPELRPRGDDHWTVRRKSDVIRGEASSNAKLTVALVEEIIRTDFSVSGSVGAFAERLGVTTGAIMAVLTRRTWRSVTDGRIILSEGNVGKIHTELSAERRSRATKAQFLAGRTMTGERNPRAKTTWDDVREIRRIGVGPRGSNQRLAERFGITKGQIGRILNGSSWIE